ncbi:MAG: hypothetical protein AAFN07_14860 [Pseudomonadota bacterium]
MNEKLLDIVCCPLTHQALRKARSDELSAVNDAIGAETLLDASGAVVGEALLAGLVTMDGTRMYPLKDGLVSLLPETAISLTELENSD